MTRRTLRPVIHLLVAAFVFSAAGGYASAAEDKPSGGLPGADKIQELVKNLNPKENLPGAEPTEASGAVFAVKCEKVSDAETQKICWQVYREYLLYYEAGYKQRQSVIAFQNVSTKVILVVVVSLVVLGMFFAWYQFRIAMRAMEMKLEEGAPVDGAAPAQEINIGQSGVVARSSYLGVIILIISLAFFYLYLIFVYPIEDVF